MRSLFSLVSAAALASVAAAVANTYFVGVNVGAQLHHGLTIVNCEPGALGLDAPSSACVSQTGILLQLDSRNVSAGLGSFNRTTYTIGIYPCPHVGAKHEFFSVSTNASMNGTMGGGPGGMNGTMGGGNNGSMLNGTGLGGGLMNFSAGNGVGFGGGITVSTNISYDAYAHYLALTHLFTYTENNSLPGAQPSEFVGALPICGGSLNKLLSWGAVKYSNWTCNGTDGSLVVVHNFSKCANVSDLQGPVGQLCFVFAIGNGTYLFHGVERLPGQVKVDQVFYPYALANFNNKSAGVAGVYFSSSDVANASLNFNANTKATENSGKTLASFQPNVLVAFGNGAVAYLNWNTSVTVKSMNGTVSTANVNVTEWDTATFNAALGISTPLATSYAQSSLMVTRSTLVFSFEKALGDVQVLAWDPDMGSGAMGTTTDPVGGTSSTPAPSSKAAVGVNISSAILAIVCFLPALTL